MKIRRVRLSGVNLVNFFEQDREVHFRVLKGLPEGTKFIHVMPSNYHWDIEIVVEHESFEDLKDGDIIPNYPDIELYKL